MGVIIDTEQKQRYLTDPEYHAKVEVVAQALWIAVSKFELNHRVPYPFDKLETITKEDLMGYGMAAVEAIEELSILEPGDQLALAVELATKPGKTRTHAFKSLPAALRRYREATGKVRSRWEEEMATGFVHGMPDMAEGNR